MSEKKVDLCIYRMRSAIETLGVSALCLESQHYKDSINRSYYAAFYAVKAVLALEEVDLRDIKMLLHILIRHMLQQIFFQEKSEKSWED